MFKRLTPSSDFSKNVLTLMTGTTIAQALPIAVTPILTRLYEPDEFGVFALFIAITSIFGSIACGRYEMAIMLPKDDSDSNSIIILGLIINVFLSIALLFVILIWHEDIVSFFDTNIGPWLYFIPISVFFMGIFNLGIYYKNRNKDYKNIAKINVVKSTSLSGSQLIGGVLKVGSAGLIVGHVISQFISSLLLFNSYRSENKNLDNISKRRLFKVASDYNKFPKYTLWAGLANVSSVHLTNILISTVFNVATLGFYSIVQRVLGAPSGLIGASVGQVFFQEATHEKQQTGSAKKSFFSTLKKLLIIGLPSFLVIYFTIELIFLLFFGEKWIVAGEYAKKMIPLFFIIFIVSPLTVINQVNLQNKLGMYWQIGLLLLNVLILYVSKLWHLDFLGTLTIMVHLVSAYYLFFLLLMVRQVINPECEETEK